MDEKLSRLIAGLQGADRNMRESSAEALAACGSEVAEAIPDLNRLCEQHSDADVRRCSVLALGGIGFSSREDVLSILLQTLKDPDSTVRAESVLALGILDRPSKTVGPLAEALKDTDDEVRFHAAGELGELGPEAAGALKVLMDSARDPNEHVRCLVVWALGEIDCVVAIPSLEEALNGGVDTVRTTARMSLNHLKRRRV
jgi:HEAT repeat protein